jgi:cytochrome c7-like protein
VRASRAGAALALLVGALGATSCARPVNQAIAFNHKLHAYNNVPCLTCHPSAETGQGATLPAVAVCRRCHEDVLYESPEKAKIRLAVESGHDLPWVPVYALRSYVYFSHRRHVTLGKIRCRFCHGDVERQASPFRATSSPFGRRGGMNACINCHEESHSQYAGVDCVNCHR